jgi:pimeloyl-ACP methyl ester carboxylesterase
MNSDQLTFPKTAEEHTVVNGVGMTTRRARERSQRPPVVLVHGGMHAAWVWADVQEWLSERGWDSVAVDLLSHGRSRTLPTEQWVTRSLIDSAFEIDVACASIADNPLPPVVMGWSMGGLATLAHVADTSQPLTAMVLLCPATPAQFKPAGGVEIPLEIRHDEPVPAFPPEVAHFLFYDGMSVEKAATFSSRLQPESPRAVVEATQWTAALDISGIEVPTLIVGAENDQLIPVKTVQSLARTIPGASYIHLRGAGHGVPINPGWESVMSMVTSWLALGEGAGPQTR